MANVIAKDVFSSFTRRTLIMEDELTNPVVIVVVYFGVSVWSETFRITESTYKGLVDDYGKENFMEA